jgi:hypothetical protein
MSKEASLRLRGTARKIDERLYDLIFRCEKYTPIDKGDEVDYSACDNLIEAFKGLVVNFVTKYSETLDMCDDSMSLEELDYLQEKFQETKRKFMLAFVSNVKPFLNFQKRMLEAIAEDDKRIFFKKINKEMRDRITATISLTELNHDGWMRNIELLNSFDTHDKDKIEEIEDKIKQRIENEELDKIRSKERAKSDGQSDGLMKLYKGQIEMLAQSKKEGLAIDNEIFAMREKLLTLEKQENSAILEELKQTLNSI